MATLADGRVTIQLGVRPAVNARIVLAYFRRVAGGAELDSARGRVHHIVRSVAGNASGTVLGVTQHRVRTGAELGRHIVMAGQTGSRRRFRRMPTLGGPGVAIHTTQVFVNAVRQRTRVYRNGLPLGIHHAGSWSVAGETLLGCE